MAIRSRASGAYAKKGVPEVRAPLEERIGGLPTRLFSGAKPSGHTISLGGAVRSLGNGTAWILCSPRFEAGGRNGVRTYDRATAWRQGIIGDFTRWKDHDAYKQSFERVVRDLTVPPAK